MKTAALIGVVAAVGIATVGTTGAPASSHDSASPDSQSTASTSDVDVPAVSKDAPAAVTKIVGARVSRFDSASPASKTAPADAARNDRMAGNWVWWGYRTNAWQTWAIATQSPTYIKLYVLPFSAFATYVYVQAWVWKLTAQNARKMGKCIGITWAGSGIITGCSSS